jgi:hypothetical protein
MNIVLPEIDVAASRIVTATIEGILEEEDLLGLLNAVHVADDTGNKTVHVATSNVVKPLSEPPSLKRIKERHHGVARLIASGLSQSMVAAITNYNEQYLSVLLNNPAMEELVSLYRMQQNKSAEIITEKLRTVGTMALEKLADRMEDLDDNTLVSVAKLGLDRAGHGPASTQKIQQETHFIDHGELMRLNAEARKRNEEYITPMRSVRAALPAPKEDEAEFGGDEEGE